MLMILLMEDLYNLPSTRKLKFEGLDLNIFTTEISSSCISCTHDRSCLCVHYCAEIEHRKNVNLDKEPDLLACYTY